MGAFITKIFPEHDLFSETFLLDFDFWHCGNVKVNLTVIYHNYLTVRNDDPIKFSYRLCKATIKIPCQTPYL